MPPDSGAFLASGTTATCTAQGFFNELGNLATPLYNASLCAYYVLVIRQSWSETRIRIRVEKFMHAVPIVIASTIAILGLVFKLYNNSGWLCWIAKYPKNCSGPTCTRGEYADIFRWVHYAIIWTAIICVTLGMYLIYLTVKDFEKEEAEENNEENARMERSRKVAIQSALFVGALYLTWSFTTITRIYQVTTGNNSTALLVLMAIFFPLQGFFNFLVFCRPRYLRCKSRNPGLKTRQLLWMTLHPEDDTKNRGPAATRGGQPRPTDRRRYTGRDRRSMTQSYYTVETSHNYRRSYPTSDDYSDVNTVKAVADENDFRRPEDDKVEEGDNEDESEVHDEEEQRPQHTSEQEKERVDATEDQDAMSSDVELNDGTEDSQKGAVEEHIYEVDTPT